MATPCRAYSCPELVTRRVMKGYCDKHSDMRVSWSRNHTVRTGTATGRPWRRIRDKVLRRDGYLCVTCQAKGLIVEAAEVDHIVPKSQGGTESLENLEAICVPCHKRKTFMESQVGYMRG